MATSTTTRYYVASWSGLFFAGIAGIGATAIIVQDAFPNGWADWGHVKLEHALVPVLVTVTAFMWLHATREMREGKLAAIPLAVVATFCSGLIVFESMGRGAENLDRKIKTAEISVGNREAQTATLIDTRRYLAEQLPKMKTECLGAPEPLPPNGWHKCRWFTGTVSAYRETIARIEGELKTAPVEVVDARGDRVEFLAAWAGFDGAKAKQAAQSLYPLARPLAFEFVMILLLHASVRTREVKPIVEAKALVAEAAPVETKALSFERPLTEKEKDDLREIFKPDPELMQLLRLLANNKEMFNQQLAQAAKVSPGEMSRRCQKAENAGIVERRKEGKHTYIRLVPDAEKQLAA